MSMNDPQPHTDSVRAVSFCEDGIELKTPYLEEQKEVEAKLDDIFTQLHEADDRIAKDRQETKRLGQETRAMLAELKELIDVGQSTSI